MIINAAMLLSFWLISTIPSVHIKKFTVAKITIISCLEEVHYVYVDRGYIMTKIAIFLGFNTSFLQM